MRVPRLSVWPTLPPGLYGRRPHKRLPYPLGEEKCRVFARGRHAIFHGVRALGLGPGDQVLVPAYHHGSEVEALIRAGVEPRFYDCAERLEPAEEVLSAMLTPRVRALHLIHYLGFPQDSPRWRRFCDEHGLLLIEDAAQAWLSSDDGTPVGSLGDLAIFCLYKTVGVPEGAALISRLPPPEPSLDPRWGGLEIVRRHGAWLAERSPAMNALTRPLQRGVAEPGRETGLGDVDVGIWRAIPWMLPRLCDPGIAVGRRANFAFLLDALGEQVPTAFREPPEGASPFAFPLAADDKPALLDRLAERGVRALNLWSIPHPSLPVEDYPDARRRRAHTLGLPVHQELRPDDLERIVAALRPRSRAAPGWRIEPLAEADAEIDRWRALAQSAGNIFATPEWLETWWGHYGRGKREILACRRDDGSLRAILPLYRSRVGGVRTLRFLGHGPSDQLGPICDPAERIAVARAFRRALREGVVSDWDLMLAEQVPGDQGWSALLGGSVLRRESSPVLHGGRSFEDLLASRSPNFRQQVRGRERKLRRESDLEFRLADDPARLQEDLSLLFDLHAARWNDASTAFSPKRQGFHRAFAPIALERGWLRLWFAEVEEGAIAALYGFRFAGDELYYQSGRDPAWDRYRVGFVLLAHAIKAALDDGVAEYRLLRGDEPYKFRFASHDPGLETFVAARGALARTAVAAARPLVELDPTPQWLSRLIRGDSP